MEVPYRLFGPCRQGSFPINEDRFHSERPRPHKVPSWIISHKDALRGVYAQFLDRALENLPRRFAPADISAKHSRIDVLPQPQTVDFLAP